jgi:hypothetical protein
MSVLKRISGMFKSTSGGSTPPPARGSVPPNKANATHREKLGARDADITAQFALAFQALDATASRGAAQAVEMASVLKDESQKLKDKLKRMPEPDPEPGE